MSTPYLKSRKCFSAYKHLSIPQTSELNTFKLISFISTKYANRFRKMIKVLKSASIYILVNYVDSNHHNCVYDFCTYYSYSKSMNILHILRFNSSILIPFTHTWLIDDDLAIDPSYNIQLFLNTVNTQNFIISSPVLLNSWYKNLHDSNCKVQKTNFVEIQAPIIKVSYLYKIYNELFNVRSDVDWGLDRIWCKYVNDSCAIFSSLKLSHIGLDAKRYRSKGHRSQYCMFNTFRYFYIKYKHITNKCLD